MKVQIISENGEVLFEHNHSPNYFYQKSGQELFQAILTEAAWKAHNPLFKSITQTDPCVSHQLP